MTTLIPRRGIAALALAFLMVAAQSAHADMVVVRTNGGPLKPGQTVATGATITLPAGVTATLVGQDGKTLTLNGPYSGTPSPASAAAGDPKVVTALSRLLIASAADSSALGVTRGTAIRDPYAIELVGGTHCQVPSKQPYFVRGDTTGPFQIVITAATGDESTVNWTPGSARASWPDTLRFDAGTYLLRRPDRPDPVRLSVRRVPQSAQEPAAAAAWMADHGCSNQALALLKAMP